MFRVDAEQAQLEACLREIGTDVGKGVAIELSTVGPMQL